MVSIVIHQPNLFPSMKVLQKLCSADLWVVYDNVQFVRKRQSRCHLRSFSGRQEQLFTLAVSRPSGRHTLIKDVRILNIAHLPNYLLHSCQRLYGRSPFWSWIEHWIESLEFTPSLAQFDVMSLMAALNRLDLPLKYAYASDLRTADSVNPSPTRRILDICLELSATAYICGPSAAERYFEPKLLRECNIRVYHQRYRPPGNLIAWDESEWKDISFLDYVARFGPAEAKRYLSLDTLERDSYGD